MKSQPHATEEKARPLVKLRSGKYIGDWAHGRLALFYEDGMVCRDLDPYLETELARMLISSETEASKDAAELIYVHRRTRDETIEECARQCDGYDGDAAHCAILIRALKNAAPQVAREREQGGTPMTSSPAVAAPLSAIEQGTPRTDAEVKRSDSDYCLDGYVDSDFARQLERELAEAKQEAVEQRNLAGSLLHERDELAASLTRSSRAATKEVGLVFTEHMLLVDTGEREEGFGNIAWKVKDEQAKPILDALRARSATAVSVPATAIAFNDWWDQQFGNEFTPPSQDVKGWAWKAWIAAIDSKSAT